MEPKANSTSSSGGTDSKLQEVIDRVFALPVADASKLIGILQDYPTVEGIGEAQCGVEGMITEALCEADPRTTIWQLAKLSKSINEALSYLSGDFDTAFTDENIRIPPRCQEAEPQISDYSELYDSLLRDLESLNETEIDNALKSVCPKPGVPFSVWAERNRFAPWWMDIPDKTRRCSSILFRILTVRLRPVTREHCREIMARSTDWPITVSHITDRPKKTVEQVFQELALGRLLGLRIEPTGKPGKKPGFEPGSSIVFAFGFYEYIEFYRWLRNQDPWGSGDSISNNPKDPIVRCGSLPALSAEAEILEKWIEMSMERAEEIFGDKEKWHEDDWPVCVKDRWKEKQYLQSVRLCVKDELREGFELIIRHKLNFPG